MLINDAVYSASNNNLRINQPTKQEEANTSLSKLTSSANADIATAAEGESFNGTITNVNGEQVSILLDSNKVLNAKMSEGVSLNIGDMITFQVKENNGSNVLIKPVVQDMNAMKDGTIFKILDANNLSPTEKNYAIAEALLNNNLPVDKGSMQKLMQQSYKYPDASIDTLVALNKMNIPVNEANIAQYNDYINNKHQLTNNISNFTDTVVKMQTEVLNNMATGNEGTAINSIIDTANNVLNAISDEVDAANFGEIIPIDEAASETAIVLEANEELEAKLSAFSEKTSGDFKLVSELTGKLKEMGVSDENISKLLDKSSSNTQLLNNINEMLTNMKDIPEAAVKEFFTGKEYGGILKQALNDKMTLNPSEMKDPSEIDEVYKNIYEKTNKLLNAFSNEGGSTKEQLNDQAKGMNERLDFIQNLNNMYAYSQIPLKMNSKELNSELFVYMNKKGISDKKEAVSALLHLDMEHLGATDVHVSLHGGIVHTRFYVEDEESARIIDEHMNMLEKAINESGYTLTNEVINREVSVNHQTNAVVNEMFDTELEKSVKRYSFDVRM